MVYSFSDVPVFILYTKLAIFENLSLEYIFVIIPYSDLFCIQGKKNSKCDLKKFNLHLERLLMSFLYDQLGGASNLKHEPCEKNYKIIFSLQSGKHLKRTITDCRLRQTCSLE